MRKSPKNRRGTRPVDYGSANVPPRSTGPLTPGPPLRGTRTCWILQNYRRAKSEWHSKFPPAHWGLAVPKLQSVRFQNCAWLCRAGGSRCWAVGRGLLDAPRTSAGRPVSGPYETEGELLYPSQGRPLRSPAVGKSFQHVGAAHRAAHRSFKHTLRPTQTQRTTPPGGGVP